MAKKSKSVNFQFISDQNKIANCFVAGKPGFYIPQITGSWHGFIIQDKSAAEQLKYAADRAFFHFERLEKGSE